MEAAALLTDCRYDFITKPALSDLLVAFSALLLYDINLHHSQFCCIIYISLDSLHIHPDLLHVISKNDLVIYSFLQ